jgi:hypothetical protein
MFGPKDDEGIFLVYASNAHGYRVLNKTTGFVDVSYYVTFDESNGYKVEQVDEMFVGKEISTKNAVKKMAIGQVKPPEEDGEDYVIIDESPSATPIAHIEVSGEKPEVSGIPETPDPQLVTLKAVKIRRM